MEKPNFKRGLKPKEALGLVPPKPPPGRRIREGSQPWCPYYGSSRAYGGLLNLFPKNGCIQPDCINYFQNEFQT